MTEQRTIYLWQAYLSEPGQGGSTCTATYTETPPAPLVARPLVEGLVPDDARHGDWVLRGTTVGEIVEMEIGNSGFAADPVVIDRHGEEWEIWALLESHRFRHVGHKSPRPA